MQDFYKCGFPTEKLEMLRDIKGKTLLDIVKIIKDTVALEKLPELYSTPLQDIFHTLDTPVVLQFSDSLSIGICPAYENLSVATWLERSVEMEIRKDSIFFENDTLLSFSVRNRMFAQEKFQKILGHTVKTVKYYKRHYTFAGAGSRQCEPGIGLEFTSGKEIIFSRDFLTNTGDFEILFKEEIHPDVLPELEDIIIA